MPQHSVISIISDWKKQEFYLVRVKARIISRVPDARIVDITHQIQSYDISQAAYILAASWAYFPKGSIHIMAVQTASAKEHPQVLISKNGHYFIGADHGLWPFILGGPADKSIMFNESPYYEGNTFPSFSLFADIAAAIYKGMDISEAGRDIVLSERTGWMPQIEDSGITGNIIYYDSYGNAISNISADMLERHFPDTDFQIEIFSSAYLIPGLSEAYTDVRRGDMLGIININGFLEVAIREGNLKQLLDLSSGAMLRVQKKNG